MMRSWLSASAIAAACVLTANPAQASVVITGDVSGSAENTGATFSGELAYTHIGGSVGELTITLTNDTPLGVGGRLTAIVFRFDTVDAFASTLLLSSTVSGMTDTGVVNGAPFGTFMGGAGTGGQFEGGGSPSNGLAIGASATFVWAINASDAGSLTDLSFINAADQPSLVARFRGLADGGSDKVPGTLVPAPGSLALLGAGLLVAGRRRK